MYLAVGVVVAAPLRGHNERHHEGNRARSTPSTMHQHAALLHSRFDENIYGTNRSEDVGVLPTFFFVSTVQERG